MSTPTPQPIADWLEKLGLGQYAQCFTENEIDVSVLRHLTDQDLKDIGVPLGHRRKILAAISEAAGKTAPAAPSNCIRKNSHAYYHHDRPLVHDHGAPSRARVQASREGRARRAPWIAAYSGA